MYGPLGIGCYAGARWCPRKTLLKNLSFTLHALAKGRTETAPHQDHDPAVDVWLCFHMSTMSLWLYPALLIAMHLGGVYMNPGISERQCWSTCRIWD